MCSLFTTTLTDYFTEKICNSLITLLFNLIELIIHRADFAVIIAYLRDVSFLAHFNRNKLILEYSTQETVNGLASFLMSICICATLIFLLNILLQYMFVLFRPRKRN